MWICFNAPNGLDRLASNGRRILSVTVSGKTKYPRIKLNVASPAAAKNGIRKPNSPKSPPKRGPRTNPTPKLAPKIPKFADRVLAVDISEMKAAAVDCVAAAIPPIIRVVINNQIECAKPITMKSIAITIKETKRTGRRP